MLEAINRQAGAELLAERNGRVEATQFVGVVRLGETVIQVLPKIYRTDAEAGAAAQGGLGQPAPPAGLCGGCAHQRAGCHAAAPPPLGLVRDLDSPVRLPPGRLVRRGALHSYRTVEQELAVLKGRWRIADQLRRPASLHQFHVTYDEFRLLTPKSTGRCGLWSSGCGG